MIPGGIRQKWRQELCSSRSGWRNQSVRLHPRVRSRFRLKANASLFVLTVAGLEFGIKPMRRSIIFRMALLALAVLAVGSAEAGSAVAIGPHNQMATSCGYPEKIAKQRALQLARHRYGPNVRLLAASDVTGYGAIAVAHHGIGWVTGVALGRHSAREAEVLARDACLRAGGTDPKVRWEFKG
jgi:hypothetical protein